MMSWWCHGGLNDWTSWIYAESMVFYVSYGQCALGKRFGGILPCFLGVPGSQIQELGLSQPAPQYQEGQVTRPNSMGNVPEKCLDSRSLKSAWYYMLIGGLEHEFYFSIQLGMSSSQLTLSPWFFRGVGYVKLPEGILVVSTIHDMGILFSQPLYCKGCLVSDIAQRCHNVIWWIFWVKTGPVAGPGLVSPVAL